MHPSTVRRAATNAPQCGQCAWHVGCSHLATAHRRRLPDWVARLNNLEYRVFAAAMRFSTMLSGRPRNNGGGTRHPQPGIKQFTCRAASDAAARSGRCFQVLSAQRLKQTSQARWPQGNSSSLKVRRPQMQQELAPGARPSRSQTARRFWSSPVGLPRRHFHHFSLADLHWPNASPLRHMLDMATTRSVGTACGSHA